jgi:hypothetical protein
MHHPLDNRTPIVLQHRVSHLIDSATLYQFLSLTLAASEAATAQSALTRYEPYDQGIAAGFLSGARDFSPLQSVQTGCEANPVFYSMDKVVPAHGIKITEAWVYSTMPRVPI